MMTSPELSERFSGETAGSMSEFSAEYMSHIERRLEVDFTHVPDRILAILRALDDYVQGFAVSQLEHCLQTATRAERYLLILGKTTPPMSARTSLAELCVMSTRAGSKACESRT